MLRRTFFGLFATFSLFASSLAALAQTGELPLGGSPTLPPAPSEAIAAAVGEYGDPRTPYTVYEQGGDLRILRADLPTLDGHAIRNLAEAVVMDRGQVVGLRTADGVLPRLDVGADTVAHIQAGIHGKPARVRQAALAATPPVEPPSRARSDLVALTSVDPTIKLDIRYATANNFMGFPLYERANAYLQRPAAEAVARANAALKAYGFGLLIHDGYRPWYVTRMFWDATPDYAHVFVADPAKGSRHNRGCAVDLTLYDLKTGQAVEMTGRYDEMSPRSYADYKGGTSRQRALRDLLRREMEAQGFSVYPEEWWHFDFGRWADYAIGTATFSELATRQDK